MQSGHSYSVTCPEVPLDPIARGFCARCDQVPAKYRRFVI
jgi:hypothetical protein